MKTPTSPATEQRTAGSQRDASGGFTLIETMLALAVIALVAALALPRGIVGSQTGAVRAATFQVAALVRSDRNAALRSGRAVTTRLDRENRVLHAGASADAVALSPSVPVTLLPGELRGFTFGPDGTATGGSIVLGNGALAYRISINPVTAAVNVDKLDLSTRDVAGS